MKTDAFEDDLRHALAHRAAEIPAEAVDRLRTRNYRPHSRNRVLVSASGLVTAAAVGVALAVTMLLPSGYQGIHHAQLAAWTVAKQADSNISVTIRELRDPAGLQRTLRADGVPVSVTFTGQQNPACQPYPFSGGQSQHRHLLASMAALLPGSHNAMVIYPSAFPVGVGLHIAAGFHNGVEIEAGPLVKASRQCTGS